MRQTSTQPRRELLQSAKRPRVKCQWRTRMCCMTSSSDTNAPAGRQRPSQSRQLPAHPAQIGVGSVVLDTDDPPRLAEFYTALLGWQIESTEDDWITIGDGSGAQIDFQLALNHKPPTWPDNAVPQQFHLDLGVDDLDQPRRTRSRSVPGAPPAATMRPTSSCSSIRAAIRSVCAHERLALTL